MDIYEVWGLCVIFNWAMILKYIWDHKQDFGVQWLRGFVPYTLVWSTVFGPVWSLAVTLYYLATMNDEKDH